MPPSDRLRLIRQHVMADAAGFSKMLKHKKFQARFGGLQQEGKLIRPPKGFDADAPHIEFIKLKNFIAWKETILTKKFPDDLGQDLALEFRDVLPLMNWLRQVK